MKAMILAAGIGSRLQPLTDTLPKALIPVHGKPLLEWIIRRLIVYGFDEIIINIHHHAGQMKKFLQDNNYGIRIALSEEDILLDTGGGLKKAGWFFSDDEPFLIHNVDVLTSLDLTAFYNYHRQSNALATLAVRDRKTSRYLIFADDMTLCGWKSLSSGETFMVKRSEPYRSLSFMGVHMISPELLPLLDQEQAFSIIKTYLRLVTHEHVIKGYLADSARWLDLGTRENLQEIDKVFDTRYFDHLLRWPAQ